ncbi:CaiB/BaiF CoA transferase family protein [Pseudonocardia halophobica]|uniref:CaiB/BaiF CoA transferase family protein n=1 Tax=Pseudonocardia halophobica TaxID=29401 RepID=UPI003D93BE05
MPDRNPSPGPLAGLRVIELGTILAASTTARILGDFGAEVIKVEAPDRPDPMRYWGRGTYEGRALWWPVQSRNKKLVTANLRTPEGAELFVRLCDTADVVVENFRPGTLERWGLGYDRLSRDNPGLVLARISGYGQTGPYAARPGYAAVGEAMGGIRYINGYPDMPPPRSGLSLGDTLAGMFTSQGVMAALHERQRSGRGQVVDTSLVEACMAVMESSFAEYDKLGVVRGPSGTGLPGVSPSNLFRSRDGKWVVIAANQDQIFVRLCSAMGCPELATDPRYDTHVGRAANQVELEQTVADWVAEHDAAELDTILTKHEVVAGPVYSVADIVADPHVRDRGSLVVHHDDDLGDFLSQEVVPRLDRTPGSVRWTGPWELGAHNAEVYGGLGLDDAQLADLQEGGHI